MNPVPAPAPRDVASQWFQRVWNERDEAAIDELMSPTARGVLAAGQEVMGPAQFKEFFRAFATLFPDLRVRLLDVMEDGEKVVVRWEARGTHAGEGLGLKATQRVHTFSGMTWMVVRNGQIVDGGDSWNQDGLLARMASASAATPPVM